MNSQLHHNIDNIHLNKNEPTQIPLADLYQWVIWQFPRQLGTRLCCAIHPPSPEHSWYPALIDNKDNTLEIFGHIDLAFSSPEKAVDWLELNGDSKIE